MMACKSKYIQKHLSKTNTMLFFKN